MGEINEKYPDVEVTVRAMDVSNPESVDAGLKDLPPIDVLVNNAGLALGVNKTAENTVEAINTVIDTNVKGVLYLIRAVVPGMIERNSGFVINVSSIAGQEAYRGGSIYCASKHAVQAITNSLRKELVQYNIRVCSVCPGLVETEFSIVRLGDADVAKTVYQGYEPLVADDIADNFVYVASRPPHVQVGEITVLPSAQASCEVRHVAT